MYKYAKVLLLGAVLASPVAIMAQEHAQVRIYVDKTHHDKHEWNHDEDERYRNYLLEHHRDYRAFERMNRRDQDAYWKWRHDHDDHH
jgi:hypothetical protein